MIDLLSPFSKDRWPLIATSFLMLLASLFVGTFSPPDQSLMEELQAISELFKQYGVLVLVLNNALASIIMVIPLLGLGFGVFIAHRTGIAISSISSTLGMDPRLALFITIIMPHALLEFLAYSVALSQNLAICQGILMKRGVGFEIKKLPATIIVTLVILLVAAFVEAAIISLAGGTSAFEALELIDTLI